MNRELQIRPLGVAVSLLVVAVLAAVWAGSVRAAAASLRAGRAPVQDARSPSAQGSSSSSASSVSILDGVFTRSQATRGDQRFSQVCAACHTAGEFTGRRFAAKWDGITAGDLFELISTTMPEGDPASLTPEEYVSVLAFLLRASGYPEGEQDLPADPAALMKIRIVPLPDK